MDLALQHIVDDQVSGQTSGTPIYIQDASGNFVPIGTIATGGAVAPITPTSTDLMTRNEIKGLVTLSIETALDDYDKRFLKMETEFKSLEKKVLRELKGKRGDMSIDDIIELIIQEIETSKEPVYPGSIAIKYKIPYKDVEKATKKLHKNGMIELR